MDAGLGLNLNSSKCVSSTDDTKVSVSLVSSPTVCLARPAPSCRHKILSRYPGKVPPLVVLMAVSQAGIGHISECNGGREGCIEREKRRTYSYGLAIADEVEQEITSGLPNDVEWEPCAVRSLPK